MHFKAPLSSLFLLQLSSSVLGLPAEQKPIQNVVSESVLKVRAELKKAEIIPTVIDDFLPTLTVSVSWDKNHSASLGNTLKPKRLQDAPTIKIHDDRSPGCVTSNMTYVLALTDPDAPSRDNPEWSEMCHWIAAGVPLSSSTSCAAKNKVFSILPWFGGKLQKESEEIEVMGEDYDEIMEYKPPGPPPKTGKHRYVFLVFAPANGTTLPLDLSKPSDRQHWGGEEREGVREWAEDNGLVPVAANFIYAKNKKQ